MGKEVIINDPDYTDDAQQLVRISTEVKQYSQQHNLKKAPSWTKVFFYYEPDHEIERISQEMETVIDDLTNTRDKTILHELNGYPVLSEKAHTRPFERRWLNIAAAIVVPVGLLLYLRMWKFRLRLDHDLKTIYQTNEKIVRRIDEMNAKKQAAS